MIKTAILFLPLLLISLFTSCNSPSSTPKIPKHYSGIQLRIYGSSVDTMDDHEDQVMGLFIDNKTNDTLYQLSGRLLLLDANTDTLGIFDFLRAPGDDKLTFCTATINGQKLHSEDRFLIDPNNTVVETVVYSPDSGAKFGNLISSLPDHYSCVWVLKKR